MQFSLLNGSVHDRWLQQGHHARALDEHSRLACEVLRSRKPGKVCHSRRDCFGFQLRATLPADTCAMVYQIVAVLWFTISSTVACCGTLEEHEQSLLRYQMQLNMYCHHCFCTKCNYHLHVLYSDPSGATQVSSALI